MIQAIDLIKAALLKANPEALVLMIEKEDGSKIQSLIFDKKKFTEESAKKWASDHKFKSSKVDVTENTIRLRQIDPGSVKIAGTKKLTDGIQATFGLKKSLMDEIKEHKLTKKEERVFAEQTETSKSNIFKKEELKQIVYGVVLEPWTDVTPEGDAHGDRMTKEEIEKSAHGFMQDFQKIKEQHNNEISAKPVESFIAPCDYAAPDGSIVKEGSWVMAVKIEDKDVWEKVLKEEITAFSPGGFGERISLEKE